MHDVCALDVIVLTDTPNARIGVEDHLVRINMSDLVIGSELGTGGKNMTGLGILRETVSAVGRCCFIVVMVNLLDDSHMDELK